MVKEVQVTRWRTKDGKLFETEDAAKQHEIEIFEREQKLQKLEQLLKRNQGHPEGYAGIIYVNYYAIKTIMGE